MRLALGLALAALLALPACGGDEAAAPAEEQVLRIGHVGEPETEGEAWDLLTDLNDLNVPWNLFDPLVKVDDDLEPVPNVAERWDWSDDGLTITFHLRGDGRWTNGDPLTAHDYVYGWRQALAEGRPHEGDPPFAIAGLGEFLACDPAERTDCDELWDDVGVHALDDRTLEVRLSEPQPWLPAYLGGYSCVCFGPLHRETVERFGADWAEPEHIVTSGPFKLESWTRGESLTLVKDPEWRGADDVELERVELRHYRTHEEAARALVAGEIDVTEGDAGPAESRAVYPRLSTRFVGLSVEDVPDARQRRAMALAIDRRELVANAAPAEDLRPATSLTADSLPDFGRIRPGYLGAEARLDEARRLLAAVEQPVRRLKLWILDSEPAHAIAAELRAAWRRLGIEASIATVPRDEYVDQVLERKLDGAHYFGLAYDAPHPASMLDNWRCGYLWNTSGYCDPAYDRLLDRAAREDDDDAQLDLYRQAEALLTGETGSMHAIPLAWGSNALLEGPRVRETFELNPAGQVDFTRVEVARD